jgi:glutamate 5-kinase
MKARRKDIIKKARRVVVKVGSAVLAGCPGGTRGDNAGLDCSDIFTRLAGEIHLAKAGGREVVLVTSGAIAMGLKKFASFDIRRVPESIPERQAAAAVGQSTLMAMYDEAFLASSEHAAQILLTHDDMADRKRFLNARNTVTALLKFGFIPVINENDTVAVEEIKFGDNDSLSALVTNLVEADLLVMLSDIDGICDRDPKGDPSAKLIPFIEDIDALDVEWAADTGLFGSGGMRSKVAAARKASHFGCATVVANGFTPDILQKVLNGEDAGTFILPKEDRLTSKKHWIAYSSRPSGRVFMDDGAMAALLKSGRSLLASGIMKVDGAFDAGEVIHCVDCKGMEFARGVTNYSSREIEKIKGLKTGDIERVLGFKVYDEVIHRDNLVVL